MCMYARLCMCTWYAKRGFLACECIYKYLRNKIGQKAATFKTTSFKQVMHEHMLKQNTLNILHAVCMACFYAAFLR
jgi:hypothetical protein